MPVFANFPRQTIDLMNISLLVFGNVSGILKADRERAAKEIIQKYSNSEIMLVIAHLRR